MEVLGDGNQELTGRESGRQFAPSHSVLSHARVHYLSALSLVSSGDLFLQSAQSGENFSHLHRGEDREY